MTGDFDDLMLEEDMQLSDTDLQNLKVARLPDHQFAVWSRLQIAKADAVKRQTVEAPDTPSEDEERIRKMSDDELEAMAPRHKQIDYGGKR